MESRSTARERPARTSFTAHFFRARVPSVPGGFTAEISDGAACKIGPMESLVCEKK